MLTIEQIEDVDAALSECIDRGFAHFGGNFNAVVYYFFKTNLHLDKEVLAKTPATFQIGLEQMFGEGSYMIEREVIKEICSKFNLPAAKEQDLVRIINAARSKGQITRLRWDPNGSQ